MFLESPFPLCSLKVFVCFKSLRATFKGGTKGTDSPKTPFWTTVSPHDALIRRSFGAL